MDVLGKMVAAAKPGGFLLDLQVIRPDPAVESGCRILGRIDGGPLFRRADAAVAAVDASIRRGHLVEEAVDDHDVRTHYANGADLVAGFKGKERRLSPEMIPKLLLIEQPCAVRERCRLRGLRVR